MTREEQWQKFGDQIGGEAGQKLAEAYREFYAVFDQSLIDWVANLFDPKIGGFYYSNGARDNEGFLPDLESTFQAMGWIFNNSMKAEGVTSHPEFYPEWMKEPLMRFIKDKQDENGYFYHPQWERSLTDSKPHRRGRDLEWACRILDWYGESPTYDTPTGVRGNGLLSDGTAVKGFSHRECETVAPKEELVAPHLKNKEAFVEYLGTLDLNGNSYVVSNTIESQALQIVQRDKVLREMGADYSLGDILVDWFTEHQDKETGLFTFRAPDVDGLNGLMKACSAVSRTGRPFPNPHRGLESAISVIEGDEYMASVCCVMNPLCTINTLMDSITRFGSDEGDAAKYKKYLFSRAPEIIEATKNRILAFKKPDGSFSFAPEFSSHTSQGHPVAVYQTYEGDVNATMIATSAVIGHILIFLGLPKPPIFAGADVMRLMNILEERKNSAT